MILLNNLSNHPYSLSLVERITASFTSKKVELLICDNAAIRELNRTFRQIDAPTDVLSFPNAPMPKAPLGSIAMSHDYLLSASERFGHSVQEEFVLLYIHGLLHLLGFDHEHDYGEMRAKEEELIAKYRLPKSLIVRTEEER